MKREKRIIALSAFCLSLSVLAFALVPPDKLLKSIAGDPYTCELPSGFVDIDSVIEACLGAGNEKVNNTLKFRGTITRRMGDVAYVQRVNQTDNYAYGIRVVGLNTYANSLVEGNVVNFSNGLVYRYQGIPTFELTSESDAAVAYSLNTMGYAPIAYQTLREFSDNSRQSSYYNPDDFLTTISYASSRLIRINNLIPMDGYGSYDKDDEERLVYAFTGVNREGYIEFLVDSSLEFDSIFNSAVANKKAMNLTGYLELFDKVVDGTRYTFTFLTIADMKDVEVGGDYLDMNTIDSVRTSYYHYTDDYRWPFAIYNLKEHGDVPYVEIADFLNNCYFLGLYEGYYFNKFDDADFDQFYYYNTQNEHFEFLVDPETDIIELVYDPNYMAFTEAGRASNGLEVLATGVESDYCHIDIANSQILGTGHLVMFDLARYGLDIVIDNNNVLYAPMQALNTIFNDTTRCPTRYNGKDLYFVNGMGENTTFSSDSPWTDENWDYTVSSEFAEYAYGCFCLSLEEIYGLAEYRGICDPNNPSVSADALLDSLGYKEGLLSTDTVEHETALVEFYGTWFYEGHNGFQRISLAANKTGVDWDSIYTNALSTNTRSIQLAAIGQNRTARSAAGKGVGLTTYGDTAIIRFDSFVKYREGDSSEVDLDSFTYAQLHDIGTDLLFRKAFNEIDEMKTINNVVIDLTANGGGENDSLPFLEAYMTDDPIHTCYNKLTGYTYQVHYDVDLNYDGTFNGEGDTYQGVYNFYVMTSQGSFSCGNYFPTVVKEKGMATLIGQRSGGGTCPVGTLTTAYGSLARNSSKYMLGSWDYEHNVFKNNEEGIPVDYEFSSANFYNDEEIYNFIHTL